MRRLDLHPAKKLRGRARHERAFHRAMDRLEGWFPARVFWNGDFCHVRLPAYDKAVSQRHGHPAFRAAVVARLVGTAAAVARNRPPECHARVAALIGWPDLWPSEICVFFDDASAAGFAPEVRVTHAVPSRTEWDGGWIEADRPGGDLLALTGTVLPNGFAAHGLRLWDHDRTTGLTHEREDWVVMETATPERRPS